MPREMNRKTWFVTWSRCPLKLVDVLDQLKVVHTRKVDIKLKEYIICQEEHKSVEPPECEEKASQEVSIDTPYHVHAYLEYSAAFGMQYKAKKRRKLDLVDTGDHAFEVPEDYIFRGHFKGITNLEGIISYVTKDGVYMASPKMQAYIDCEGKKPYDAAVSLVESGETEKAKDLLLHSAPRDYLINSQRIDDTIDRLAKKQKREENPWRNKVFIPPPRFNEWWERRTLYPLVLEGPSRIGKTSFALSLFDHPLMCHGPDSLKEFIPGYHDAYIWNDCVFTDTKVYSRTDVLSIVDCQNTGQVHARFTNATVYKYIPRIFTTNPGIRLWPADRNQMIDNRVMYIACKEKLFDPEAVENQGVDYVNAPLDMRCPRNMFAELPPDQELGRPGELMVGTEIEHLQWNQNDYDENNPPPPEAPEWLKRQWENTYNMNL